MAERVEHTPAPGGGRYELDVFGRATPVSPATLASATSPAQIAQEAAVDALHAPLPPDAVAVSPAAEPAPEPEPPAAGRAGRRARTAPTSTVEE